MASVDPFSLVQIILSVLLVILVLIQVKGTGLGAEFGSRFGFYSTRRGVEKFIFYLTVGTATLFLIFSIVRLVL